ncbi:hypothetical protein [Roseibium sp. Sym1]|uniref:hypothetical protein n=1 Tax=Roseibium sp. Sym1 TaxID=3016006 RepID=UPI0022B2F466|nr:hypothetical protein [Roseibium sp. Sym1]
MSLSQNGTRTLSVASRTSNRKYLDTHTLFMVACCAVLAAGTGLLVVSSPSGLTWSETLVLATPIAGCLAVHAVIYRFMGTTCHSSRKSGADR